MSLISKAFVFVNFLFGICFFFRQLHFFRTNLLFRNSTLTKIGTAYCVFLFLVAALFLQNIATLILAVHLPYFALYSLGKLTAYFRKIVFKKHFHTFLGQVILQMKVGCCFREALHICNSYYPEFVKYKLSQIEKSVVFSQHNKPLRSKKDFCAEMTCYFIEVDQSPHMSIQRLEILKQKLSVEQHFHKKLNQLLYQVWGQALVLLTLYLALLVYILSNYSLGDNIRVITFSNVMFFLGLLLLIYLGRSFKWKL